MQDATTLQTFEIPGTLRFETDQNGLIRIVVNNGLADAEIYLHGAHLTHFQPGGEAPVIFDGKESRITPPKSAHAGIPLCWPWFGAHPTESTKPQHGFARDRVWRLKRTAVLDNNETEVVLALSDDDRTRALFPFSFALETTFRIGKTLTVKLRTTNTDDRHFTLTQALHTYFSVSDIETIAISGVEGTPFVDYTDNRKEKCEERTLTIHQEVNRVYVLTDAACTITDTALKRKIVIEKSGSRSTTIWNPWRESGIHDLPDDKYRAFVCIETTNALQDAVVLQPGESHMLMQKISVAPL